MKTTETTGFEWTIEKLELKIKEIFDGKLDIPKFYCSSGVMEQINRLMIKI